MNAEEAAYYMRAICAAALLQQFQSTIQHDEAVSD